MYCKKSVLQEFLVATQHRSGGPGATAQQMPTPQTNAPHGAPRHAHFYTLRRARLALQQPHQHHDQHAQKQEYGERITNIFTSGSVCSQDFFRNASIYFPGARERLCALQKVSAAFPTLLFASSCTFAICHLSC